LTWVGIFNGVILTFLTVELLRALLITKDWRFRFRMSKKEIEDWKKALIVMVLFVILFPIINWFFVSVLSGILTKTIGWYQVTLLLVLAPCTYLWITKRMMHLPWNWSDGIPIYITIANLLITLYLTYLI
jgi:hypothetical protein